MDKRLPGRTPKRARSGDEEFDGYEHKCAFKATATRVRPGMEFNITFKCEKGGRSCKFKEWVGNNFEEDYATVSFVDRKLTFEADLNSFSWNKCGKGKQLVLRVPGKDRDKINKVLKEKSQQHSPTSAAGRAIRGVVHSSTLFLPYVCCGQYSSDLGQIDMFTIS
jgi:hypothetical protein